MDDPGQWGTPLRVAVLHGALSLDRQDGSETERREINAAVAEMAEAIANALRSTPNAQVLVHGISHPRGLLGWLRRNRVNVVFNVCEFLDGSEIHRIPTLLERWRIPYTGNRAPVVRLTSDRVALKCQLLRHNIPTPPFRLLHAGDIPDGDLPFPLIVKPAKEHASVGIDDHSVVQDAKALRAQAERVAAEYGWPVLAESYIEGSEVTASLLEEHDGLRIIGLREFDFSQVPPGLPHIITYRAKWEVESEDYKRIRRGPAHLSPETEAAVRAVTLKTWNALGCRDYGRIDMRLDAEGRVFVIDVNPDCSLEIDSNWILTALEEGHTYETALRRILWLAVRRGRRHWE